MAVFDESKVINALHPEKAEVGKKYYFNDSIYDLKYDIENDITDSVGVLHCINNNRAYAFEKMDELSYGLIYTYS